MKTNKIFHKITVAAAGASLCLAAACNDMLDMPSKTAHESESVFQSLTLTEQAVLGIYPTFKIKAFVNYMTPDNDETMSTLTGNERAGLARYTFSAGSGQMKPVLVSRYNAINRANEVIAGIETSGKMSDPDEGSDFKTLYGEALACRAWAYFDILRYYGDCPMPLTPSKTGDNFNVGRVDRDIVYDQILGDLQQAAQLVPWQSEVAYRDRVTKAGVYGFIARIALHAAGYSLRWDLETYDPASLRLARRNDETRIKELYEMARDACNAIMVQGENDLLSDYGEVFKHVHNKEYDVETILQLGNYGSTANDEIGYSMGLAIGSGNPYYRQSGTLVRITPSFYCSFDEEDVRRDVTCVNYSLEKATGETVLTTIDNIGCGKWRKSWQKTQGPENAKTDSQLDHDSLCRHSADVRRSGERTQQRPDGGSQRCVQESARPCISGCRRNEKHRLRRCADLERSVLRSTRQGTCMGTRFGIEHPSHRPDPLESVGQNDRSDP